MDKVRTGHVLNKDGDTLHYRLFLSHEVIEMIRDGDEGKVRINPEHISGYSRFEEGWPEGYDFRTHVCNGFNVGYRVSETPEEIDEILKRAESERIDKNEFLKVIKELQSEGKI